VRFEVPHRAAIRWTRRLFRHAAALARVLAQGFERPQSVPPLVRAYWALFEDFPQRTDPLLTPMRDRRHYWRMDLPY
jgi:hypothetical protein